MKKLNKTNDYDNEVNSTEVMNNGNHIHNFVINHLRLPIPSGLILISFIGLIIRTMLKPLIMVSDGQKYSEVELI